MSEDPKLQRLIEGIRGLETVGDKDMTAYGVGERLAALATWTADALEELRQAQPRPHGGDRHNQAMYCSCEHCI
jgi:hypothetical protein